MHVTSYEVMSFIPDMQIKKFPTGKEPGNIPFLNLRPDVSTSRDRVFGSTVAGISVPRPKGLLGCN